MILNYLLTSTDTKIILLLLAVALFIVFGIIQFIISSKHNNSKKAKEEPVKEVHEDVEEEDIEKIIFENTNIVEKDKEENNEDCNVEEVAQNKRKGKYEVFRDNEFYRYRLKASNGEVLCESDIYQTEQSAIDAIEIVKKNIDVGIYQVVEEKNQMFQYKLSSRNHRTLITSSFYSTRKGAEDACEAFKRNAVTDVTVVLTDVEEGDSGSMEIYTDNTLGTDEYGTYEVLPSGKKFYFILKAQNGSVICHSQDYVSRTSCITGLEQFRNVVYEGTFYIYKDKNDNYQFKLYTKQNKLFLVGDLFENKNRVASYIKLIKRYAKLAQLK